MTIHERYGLTPVVNASGTFTPVGVSRSSLRVAQAVAEALGEFFVIDELQALASAAISRGTGAEAGAVTHCVAAGITIAVAGAMAGGDPEKVAALPDATDMPDRVVIPAGHAVDYGHPILTDVRLAGATPVLAGSPAACTVEQVEAALAHERTACLLLVSSRMVSGEPVDLTAAVAAAHRRGVPAIIDGAAQDLRIGELLATGADLVLVSAQKYLAAPTAGVAVGRRDLVRAFRAQERGIGRAMKATKEAILGVVAALEERECLDREAWRAGQRDKVAWFVEQANRIAGIRADAVPDPAGNPFPRVRLALEPAGAAWNASVLRAALRDGRPSIWTIEDAGDDARLYLELVPLVEAEMRLIVERIAALAAARSR